jgi:hypothetical protein
MHSAALIKRRGAALEMVSRRDFSAGLPTTTTPFSLSVATNVGIVGDHPDETRTPPATKDHG